ncbi:MAG: hypothetical protein RL637_596 [Pseudomonadota bacterium]
MELQQRFAFWQKNISVLPVDSKPKSNKPILKRDANTIDEICFTGFKSADKQRLTKIAIAANMLVRKEVSTNLKYLCCGYNAGPKKLEIAREKNILTLSESQFINLIETGEIPEL